ncbi:MAG: Unknown protein [uncultured Sulfurovum sp.]|uniref:Uncharacterized protein n=1 Tax=uncultured Sulfurovum sp. TaxID=269237 RepID=A0A6S6TJK8_9BACT|nr:MAG: Unknown protein [uncultured Sulfurovum sp.]
MPKQSAAIHVPITTPSEPATVTAHWQLVDSKGNIILPSRTIYTTFIVVYSVKSIFGYSYKQCDI